VRRGGPTTHLQVGLVIAALLVAACGSNATPSPSGAPPTSTPALPAVSAQASSPTGSAHAPGASLSASPAASPRVPIDTSLLASLPAMIGGQQVNEVPEIEAELASDPSLAQNAAGLAVALGINSATGDFAYVAVIQLKPLVFSNAFYSSWRQSYDQSACTQSSGLKSTGSTTIAGRQVFLGMCVGGALTYHVHLPAPDRLVSITSVGEAHFGQLVLEGLRP
jgi:hypothetical protein